MQQLYQQIHQDPEFHTLEAKRNRFNWCLTLCLLLSYFSFILIIAFSPDFFAITLSNGSVITYGIVCGLLVIIISFLLTGLYIWRANREFDQERQQLINRYVKPGDSA